MVVVRGELVGCCRKDASDSHGGKIHRAVPEPYL